MIPNNNLSILPFYSSIEWQNAKKWWVYGRVFPLFVPAGFIPPFQIIVPYASGTPETLSAYIYDANTGQQIGGNLVSTLVAAGYTRKRFQALGYDVLVFPGTLPILDSAQNGRYYIRIIIDGNAYYSDVYTVVNDIEPYLKITWWDEDDLVMDAGRIVYKYANNTQYRNFLYLQADLAKPEYIYEEEGETRDGYFFPVKAISAKKYRFNFLACEYLLDVMRFIRLSDYIEVKKNGQKYSLDSFLITPSWEAEGDVATTSAEFETATVAKKIGVGYIKSLRGDFNDDFNNDFNNQS